MFYYLTLLILLWNACHCLFILLSDRRRKQRQREVGYDGISNDLQKRDRA